MAIEDNIVPRLTTLTLEELELKHKETVELNIRRESPYYGIWHEMCEAIQAEIRARKAAAL